MGDFRDDYILTQKLSSFMHTLTGHTHTHTHSMMEGTQKGDEGLALRHVLFLYRTVFLSLFF